MTHPQVIIAFTQQRDLDVPGVAAKMPFFGGSTVIVDLKTPELKYVIRKSIADKDREQNTAGFLQRSVRNPLTALLMDSTRHDRFAALHSLADMED
jgi:hypothetical protein